MYDCGVLYFIFLSSSTNHTTHTDTTRAYTSYILGPIRIHIFFMFSSISLRFSRSLSTADDSTRSLTMQIFLYIEHIVYEGYVFYIQRNES